MDIKDLSNTLLKKWQEERPEYNYFVTDGILNYSNYNQQNPKIVFLLKESNSDFVNIAPLKEDQIGYGPKGNSNLFWRYMRGYEYIINCVWNSEKYEEKNVLKIKEFPNNNTAYVNVKKHCENNSVSSDNEIKRYATKDKDFLKEQIELINPDVIYCGGTFSSYELIYDDLIGLAPRIFKSNQRIIIDFYHLAHRYGYKTFEELYNLLTEAKLN